MVLSAKLHFSKTWLLVYFGVVLVLVVVVVVTKSTPSPETEVWTTPSTPTSKTEQVEPISISSEERFNTSAASCMNQEAEGAIQFMLSKDFDAFEDDCSDGICLDSDGKLS